MLTAKQTKVNTDVTIIDETYFFASAAQYIRELPSINCVGKYSLNFGIRLKTYEIRITAPVPISTPVFEIESIENRIISEIANMPNNHQHTTERNKFFAIELSQK